MADPEVSEAADPEAEVSQDPEERQEPSREERPARPAASGQQPDPAAAKAAKRKEHLERALKASGRTLDGGKAEAKEDEEEGDSDDEGEGDEKEAEADPKEETAAQKSERLAKLDKVKSHKHLDKALKRHAAEVAALDERERKHREKQADDDRINAAVTRQYGPYAQAVDAYRQRKDYRGTKAAIEGLLGDKFENIARNIYNVSKEGAVTLDLQQQVRQLEAKLTERETKSAETEQATAEDAQTKQLRAAFDKKIKGHDLAATGDEELIGEAFEKWRASWDEDLGEHSLSGKKAADFVLEKHRKRAEKLTGRRTAARASGTRETRDTGSAKPLREMSKEEKRKHHLERALRQRDAHRRERERHA